MSKRTGASPTCSAASTAWTAQPADRIGVTAPSFDFDGWLNSEPLTLDDLRGQVVLVRWWTETCPFCASSAPALRAINQIYGPRGLTVVGVYHPKANRDSALDMQRVERTASMSMR
jgi:thiol-disulfide isomerase/thioredoxin